MIILYISLKKLKINKFQIAKYIVSNKFELVIFFSRFKFTFSQVLNSLFSLSIFKFIFDQNLCGEFLDNLETY